MVKSFQGFRSLIESSPDAVSLINPQGEILYRSASTTRIFGYQPQEVVGQNWLDLIHPDDRGTSNGVLREMLSAPSGRIQWEDSSDPDTAGLPDASRYDFVDCDACELCGKHRLLSNLVEVFVSDRCRSRLRSQLISDFAFERCEIFIRQHS